MPTPTQATFPKVSESAEAAAVQLLRWQMEFANAGQPGRISATLCALDTDGYPRTDLKNLQASAVDTPEVRDYASGEVIREADTSADDMLNAVLDAVFQATPNVAALEQRTGLTIAGKSVRSIGFQVISAAGKVGPVG